jgi:hypothetical protein
VLGELYRQEVRPARETQRPMTDDRAPVEWLTDSMLVDYISRGGEFEEDSLPTKPG